MADHTLTEKVTSHPLESVFGVDPGTTHLPMLVAPEPELVADVAYDEKDVEVEERINTIYTQALHQSQALNDEVERVEGKYKPRLAETSAAMLNIALGAAREARVMKEHKDKIRSKSGPTNVNVTNSQTNIYATRKEALQLLKDRKATQTPAIETITPIPKDSN